MVEEMKNKTIATLLFPGKEKKENHPDHHPEEASFRWQNKTAGRVGPTLAAVNLHDICDLLSTHRTYVNLFGATDACAHMSTTVE